MEKTVTITETEYNLMVRKIRELEDKSENEKNLMPDEIEAYEYLSGVGIKRDWRHGDEGYGRNAPKWWSDLPKGHKLKMVRQAKYKKVE
jgi:hypothetical protein